MIKNVKISRGLAANIFASELWSKKIFFVTDAKIWRNCEKFFPQDFLTKPACSLILANPKPDEKNLKKIAAALKDCDFILGLGSGTINDLCKYTAAQKNISYAIFASAPSMNGYLSRNASITISGHKKTLPATLPQRVFCDLDILKSAPLLLTKAGVGDSLCFYSCWFDWYLSHKVLGTKFDVRPFKMLRDKMEFLVQNFAQFSLRDEEFLKLLIEILMLSGQGMTIAGGSYPASQSEHLIAHMIEMKYPQIVAEKLHGEMIAVTTITAAKLQKSVLGVDVDDNIVAKKTAADLRLFLKRVVATQCLQEYQKKVEARANFHKINSSAKKQLQKIHFDAARLAEIFDHFKIKYSARSLGLSKQQYQDCVSHAKFIRDRFTCLDLF